MAEAVHLSFANLPRPIWVDILRFLSLTDCYHCALSCKHIWNAFNAAQVWRRVEVSFVRGFEKDKNLFKVFEKFGRHIRFVSIRLDQGDFENRVLATEAIQKLALIVNGHVKGLRVVFCGENPLFYSGHEFIEAFQHYCATKPQTLLTKLDLSHLDITLDETTLGYFDDHFTAFVYLDLQNKQLVTKISPKFMQNLVCKAVNLADLRVFHSSLDDTVLVEFTKPERNARLKHLSIACRREEVYGKKDLTENLWKFLVETNPNLEVTLKFDHTCPLWKVRQVMKENIPVTNLFLETYTTIYPEIEITSDYYAESLLKIVIQTQPSAELDYSLRCLSRKCKRVQSLHVMCTVHQDVIDEILHTHPVLAHDPRKYTLKSKIELCPWVQSRILDEIRNWRT